MDETEIAVTLKDHDNKLDNLNNRMQNAESKLSEQSELIRSVALLAQEQGHIKDDVGDIRQKVTALAAKPGKLWDGLVEKLIFAAVGAFLAWIFAGGGA